MKKVNRKQLRFTCILNFPGKNLANTRDKAYEVSFPTVKHIDHFANSPVARVFWHSLQVNFETAKIDEVNQYMI